MATHEGRRSYQEDRFALYTLPSHEQRPKHGWSYSIGVLLATSASVSLPMCLPARYRVVQLRPDLLYLAVFDGHGGSLCAEYCVEHFERHILHHLDREEDMLVVLDKSFHDVNKSFERWYTSKKRHLGRASSSGSTATVGLLQVEREFHWILLYFRTTTHCTWATVEIQGQYFAGIHVAIGAPER